MPAWSASSKLRNRNGAADLIRVGMKTGGKRPSASARKLAGWWAPHPARWLPATPSRSTCSNWLPPPWPYDPSVPISSPTRLISRPTCTSCKVWCARSAIAIPSCASAQPDGDITPDLDALAAAIDDTTALLTLSHVTFKSGYLYEMAYITELAHRHGALVIWDLSHSAGAVPVSLGCLQRRFRHRLHL